MQANTKIYENGLRVVFQKTDSTKPFTLMVGVNTGSVNESQENNGVSHFIEHMVFKATTNRSAEDISKDLEGIGANANAFTSKYHTCFYATCMTEESEKCFELLSDMFFNSKFEQGEIDKERKVIFEEIDMYEDDPSSVATEDFTRLFFEGTKVEKSVIGTKNSLKNINREEILNYKNKFYTPDRIVISVTGGIKEEILYGYIEKYFISNLTKKKAEPVTFVNQQEIKHLPKKKFNFIKKDIVQTNIVFGFPIKGIYTSERMAYTLLSFIVGGGMSSRLFQKIREDLGLVYTIYCLPDFYDIGGSMVVSFATNSSQQTVAIEAIKKELDNLIKNGVTEEELNRAKVFCKTLIVTSSETSINTTKHNTSDTLVYNKLRTVDMKLSEIQAVTLEQINNLIVDTFKYDNMCGTVVSDKPNKKAFDCFK